jgi:hypothetical protein
LEESPAPRIRIVFIVVGVMKAKDTMEHTTFGQQIMFFRTYEALLFSQG